MENQPQNIDLKINILLCTWAYFFHTLTDIMQLLPWVKNHIHTSHPRQLTLVTVRNLTFFQERERMHQQGIFRALIYSPVLTAL